METINNNKTKEIGTVHMHYDKFGLIQNADFIPAINFSLTEEIKSQLGLIQPGSQEVLTRNADMIMSGWFTKVNDIELADREKFQLKRQVLACEKFEATGYVKYCKLRYYLEEVVK